MLANEAALRMMRWFLGLPAHAPIVHDGPLNALALMLDPGGLRPCLANWEAVGTDLPGGQREATGDGPASESGQLLATTPDVQGARGAAVPAGRTAQGPARTEPVHHHHHHARHAARRNAARGAPGRRNAARGAPGIVLPGRLG